MNRRRGIILMVAMFFVLVMGIIARAVVAVGPASLFMANQAYSDLNARRVAEAGLSYARARLREDANWRGNGTGPFIDTPNFSVVEERGNVFGLIRDLDGETGLFRLRFNYQDGPPPSASPSPTPPGDNMDDPGASHLVANPFVSINNLNGTFPWPMPQVNPSTYVASAPGAGAFQVPPGSALVWVEVFTGKNLRGLLKPDDPLPAGDLRRRNLKAVLSVSVITGVTNAALMAGGDFRARTTGGVSVSVAGTGSERPRLRSKKGISVMDSGGGGTATLNLTGEVGRDASSGLNANVVGAVTQVQETVGDSKDFLNLKWSQLVQADSSPTSTTAVQIPGGVYVFWADGSLHYYDQDLSDFKASLATNPNDPGVVLSPNLQEVRTPTNLANVPGGISVSGKNLSITKDVAVLPSATGHKAICITPREGHPLYAGDSTYNLTVDSNQEFSRHPSISVTGATVSCPDDATILCDLNADQATLIAGGSAVVSSTSVVFKHAQPSPGAPSPPPGASPPPIQPSPTQNQGLSLYVKKDLTLSSFQNANIDYQGPMSGITFAGFGDLSLEGLIYVWGNVRSYNADPAGGGATDGKLSIRGTLVAYGADPLTGLPGSEGQGQIDIFASLADLVFDAARLANTPLTTSNPTNLRPYFYDFEQ